MDEFSPNSEPTYDDEVDEFEIEGDCGMADYIGQSGVIQGENPLPPAVGMEFDSYEDVYYFYNCYAKEQGFGVRVSNTWYRKSKERYRGKLSCSSAGFKKKSEANRPRPETRTGCPAMVKFRLTENKRWRIIEVELEHNHLISPTSGKFYKSHKNVGGGTKRPLPSDSAEEVQKIRLFRTVIIDTEDNEKLYVDDGEFGITVDQSNQLKLKLGDAQAIYSFFCHLQLMSPNFFYVPEKLGGLNEYEAINVALNRAVYHTLSVDEFEAAWENMIQQYEIRDHKWLQTLYEDRKRWVPVYLKETLLAGMFPIRPSDGVNSFFEGFLHKHTPLKDFLSNYDQALQKIHQEAALADMESRSSSPPLKTRFYFELQLLKLYTNNIFKKFQSEVEGMYSCFSTRQISADGSIMTYIVKEHAEVAENRRETIDYEVIYNTSEAEVLCVCGLFNFRGYLCRHAMVILNQSGMEEIPPQYILSRWRKDIPRNYVLDNGCNVIDINNPVHRYDHLYKCGMQVVEQGRKSQDCYKFALQALDDLLNKVRIAEDLA
ncbi:FAR1-related sequence 6 [Actinidia rufa]|uniref:Protein FAR1-RELATED SEQUENCE n=1 Tax=Actinidia rufa TaxID=165716 RepID=A0A7J0FZG3_9ERIC|nr:FAR1-related sequence 6 [Actinidia rufa]